MDRDIKWTETTWKDLESIANYIAKDSKYYAAVFVIEVRKASRSI
jgi:plasmid stabilization system protein ParE